MTTTQADIACLRIPKSDPPLTAQDAADWPAYWHRLLGGHNIRAVQEAMGHRSIKSTLRYQACILPSVTSPLDPESQEMVLRQMNTLLGRLAMALPALSLSNGPALQPTKPQGP